MFVFLSKFLPLLFYPLGIACICLILSLVVKSRPRLRTILIVFTLVVLWLGGNRWIAVWLTKTLEWKYIPQSQIPNAEVIVVLGGGTDPAQYPRPMIELNGAGDRILYAAQLYREGKAPCLLVSGGNIAWMGNESSTPAADMQAILKLLDVPDSAIWQQDRSQNTYEDALYSTEMLKDRGIQRIILVTSAMHMPRSVALFEKQGLVVIPAPVDFKVTQSDWEDLWKGSLEALPINLLPSSGNMGMFTSALKEYFGLVVYRLRGWL
jgi:uncharacterized SAM-binding protein YcdF (DUF218 family)